jgi:hypothetical protein
MWEVSDLRWWVVVFAAALGCLGGLLVGVASGWPPMARRLRSWAWLSSLVVFAGLGAIGGLVLTALRPPERVVKSLTDVQLAYDVRAFIPLCVLAGAFLTWTAILVRRLRGVTALEVAHEAAIHGLDDATRKMKEPSTRSPIRADNKLAEGSEAMPTRACSGEEWRDLAEAAARIRTVRDLLWHTRLNRLREKSELGR